MLISTEENCLQQHCKRKVIKQNKENSTVTTVRAKKVEKE